MSPQDELKNFTHVDLLYPGRFLKAADLRGKSVTVTIERIVPREELVMQGGKKDRKPVLHFAGKEKGFILNVTNARSIAKAYGPELANWLGKSIVLFPTMVEAKGDQVEAIRVDVAATKKIAGEGST